jgi:clan AA aspartic protease (TIGR02281 family)
MSCTSLQRAADGVIVYIESDWGKWSDLTDFPGFLFGRTTRAELITKFGTGDAFSLRTLPVEEKDDSVIYTISYKVGDTHPLIVAFHTRETSDALKALAQKGEKYFKQHIGDDARLIAISLGDPEYIRSIWGEPVRWHDYGYKRLPPSWAFQPNETAAVATTPDPAQHNEIALEAGEGGGWRLPVLINQNLSVPFVLDTGAFAVQIPADVYSVMQRQGTIKPEDARGTVPVVMADGSTHSEPKFLLRNLKVGDRTLTDVLATVSPTGTDPLLGQSFLDRLGRYTIDNQRHVLILE